jgi:hypothetical protein
MRITPSSIGKPELDDRVDRSAVTVEDPALELDPPRGVLTRLAANPPSNQRTQPDAEIGANGLRSGCAQAHGYTATSPLGRCRWDASAAT